MVRYFPRLLLCFLLPLPAVLQSVYADSRLAAEARRQVGVVLSYDPSYVALEYPGGDVAADTGVCSDVVVRALRGLGLDLQQAIHEDMKRHPAAYPKLWKQRGTDRNIDHRRVPNIQTYLRRRGWALPVTDRVEDYLPGDIVTCLVGESIPHIMIVSDRRAEDGTPLIFHNIGGGTQEEEGLFFYTLTGHFRIKGL